MIQYLNKRDYNETEAIEQLVETVDTFPVSPKNSRIVFNSSDNCLYVHFEGFWYPMCRSGDGLPIPAVVSENGEELLTEGGQPIINEN